MLSRILPRHRQWCSSYLLPPCGKDLLGPGNACLVPTPLFCTPRSLVLRLEHPGQITSLKEYKYCPVRMTDRFFSTEHPSPQARSFIYKALDAEESVLEPSPLFSAQSLFWAPSNFPLFLFFPGSIHISVLDTLMFISAGSRGRKTNEYAWANLWFLRALIFFFFFSVRKVESWIEQDLGEFFPEFTSPFGFQHGPCAALADQIIHSSIPSAHVGWLLPLSWLLSCCSGSQEHTCRIDKSSASQNESKWTSQWRIKWVQIRKMLWRKHRLKWQVDDFRRGEAERSGGLPLCKCSCPTEGQSLALIPLP